MKTLLQILLIFTMTTAAYAQKSFLDHQLNFERVKKAKDEKWDGLRKDLTSQGYGHVYELYIAAYKAEGKLELWLKNPDQKQFKLFKTYDFCAHSGTLGPKVKEGDLQTPEGFYQINVFNPESTYHLSLGVDYPNRVDMARTGKENKPGGDIYIHGNCVTVGCIPLTDDKIKEVYLLAIFAKGGGQSSIPVSIFPFKMTAANMEKYTANFPEQGVFWQSLQKGYTAFEKHKTLAKVIQEKGNYVVK